jgi:hypothetical protein
MLVHVIVESPSTVPVDLKYCRVGRFGETAFELVVGNNAGDKVTHEFGQ